MEEKYDVEKYFKNQGYKISYIRPYKESIDNPDYIIEKDGIKKTVDVIHYVERSNDISQSVYERIMSGGFFVIIPPFNKFDINKIQIFTKDNIKTAAKTYHIWWNKKDKVK